MTFVEPSLELTFLGGDLETGHSTVQTVSYEYIINRSIKPVRQLLNGLKSASNQVQLQISRTCPSTEDIVATSGDIEAVLSDDETVFFTGYVSTDFSWRVTKHGEQVLQITLEDVGTRLFAKPFIDTGKHFFSGTASTALMAICTAAGVTVRTSDQNLMQQSVSFCAEANQTCKELIDQLVYECNYAYYFNPVGQLCLHEISADTEDAILVDSSKLCDNGGQVITLSKKIRTYKGARVVYTELGTADNYLVYRNTTGQDSGHPYCNLVLAAGEYFDGTEIYTSQEWSEATADEFREPALIGAVNADSESQIVGSNKIVNISNLSPVVQATTGLTCTFTNVGGGFFKILAHNPTNASGSFSQMDLKASIVYEKSKGVIRTDTTNVATGKGLLEEEMKWIHDKTNAEKHANLVAQYNRHCGATYTFHANTSITLGDVIQLNDDVYTGLDVYVLVYSREDSDNDLITYKGVAVSTFDLTEKAYHQITEQGPQSGAQGPPGQPPEIQYAVSRFFLEPPLSEMQWDGVDMTWDSETMEWTFAEWTTTVPTLLRGQYIWMRMRMPGGDWQYSRLTGTMVFEPMFLGSMLTETPKKTPEGLDLIPGDYFIAADTFEELGKTYTEGVPYVYNGDSWDVMDISQPGGMTKALNCLGGILENGVSVQESTSAYWGWFKNLTAQVAVIANLFARNVTVGDGDGTVGSGFRFRAQAYDGFGNKLERPLFDVFFGDKLLFDVDADGKIFFGQGFWYDPVYNGGQGAIRTPNDNTLIESAGTIQAKNALIQGDSIFRGSFDCEVIKTVKNSSIYTDLVADNITERQGYYLWQKFYNAGFAPQTGYSEFLSATVVGLSSPIAYIKTFSIPGPLETFYGIFFYDSSFNQVDIRSYLTCLDFSTPSYQKGIYTEILGTTYSTYVYAVNSFTVRVYSGGNQLEVDIPSSSSGLTRGQLYYNPSDGTVKMKL